jgi:hypothetical protein
MAMKITVKALSYGWRTRHDVARTTRACVSVGAVFRPAPQFAVVANTNRAVEADAFAALLRVAGEARRKGYLEAARSCIEHAQRIRMRSHVPG